MNTGSQVRSPRPRLSVFRSNRYIYAQIIDDILGETLAAANEKEVLEQGRPIERALAVGKLLAQRAKKKKITRVVFDRGGFAYHGRVAAVASGAREGGLVF